MEHMYSSPASLNNGVSPDWCYGSPSSKLSLREDGSSVISSASSLSATPEIEKNQIFNGVGMFYSSHDYTRSPLVDSVVFNTCPVKHVNPPFEQSMVMPLLLLDQNSYFINNTNQKLLSHSSSCTDHFHLDTYSTTPSRTTSTIYNTFSNNTYPSYNYIHQPQEPTFYANSVYPNDNTMISSQYMMPPNNTYAEQACPMPQTTSTRSKPTVLKQNLGPLPTNNAFVCSVPTCNKSFSRPYNLKSHMRTHTLERPYECQYKPCGWKFARPHDLKRHELQHTGQKPHSCRFCQKRFARSDALKRHWKVDAACAEALEEETRLNGGQQVKYPRRKRSKKSN